MPGMKAQPLKDLFFAINRYAALPNLVLKRLAFRRPPAEGFKVNLGSGRYPVPGVINCDGNLFVRPDCWIDLRNPLPFPANSCSFVTCSHTLEHLYPDECIAVLREIHRVLRPGGLARIATPSMEHTLRVAAGEFPMDWPRDFKDPLAQSVNYIFCDGQHKYAYCFSIMEEFARSAGFTRIANVSTPNDPCERMGIRLPAEPLGSLIVEMTK